jgi:hypothetical protein
VHSGLDWGRVLIVVSLLGFMFIAPAIVVWWDLRRDRRRFGPDALSRPVRYAAGGRPYREGLPPPPASGAGSGQAAVDGPSTGPRIRTDAAPGPTTAPETSTATR